MMKITQRQAVERLKAGLAHHDSFGAKPDETPVCLIAHSENCLYELPYGKGETSGQLALGDLREILSFFSEEGYI